VRAIETLTREKIRAGGAIRMFRIWPMSAKRAFQSRGGHIRRLHEVSKNALRRTKAYEVSPEELVVKPKRNEKHKENETDSRNKASTIVVKRDFGYL
jgi:hypothetical protein